ncbi:hypothetical protein LHU53_17655 [Rhodoferax sp. U2-2l]|uniref:hypothetical protein n=1 Tax=Rhodoferax sp. U2-2l TaxID=2884000 RepID=UPI001D0BB7A7|nr:hypothetical protein [Rhodoferax sp. U2-2l]
MTNTTSVAPKLRDNSLRKEEWNNMALKETRDYELCSQAPRFAPPKQRKNRRFIGFFDHRLQARERRLVKLDRQGDEIW